MRHVFGTIGVRSCGLLLFAILAAPVSAQNDEPAPPRLNLNPPPVASDKTVRFDYDIVYVRAPRFVTRSDGKKVPTAWPEIGHPTNISAGYDLMLLHPDGSEELLVRGNLENGEGSITDPFVSFDAKWVYYAHFYLGKSGSGSDIYKIHVPSRKIVRLTHQEKTPNVAGLALKTQTEPANAPIGRGVFNLGPCPVPGGRVAFTSTRDAVKTPRGYPRIAHQLHVMDDDGANIDKIGHLNVACALHPVILRDGRIIFSSLESQGIRNSILWGIWSIHPDGTNWEPVVSAFIGQGAPNAFHFQSQLSDGTIVVEMYYNQNTAGFGTFFKIPEKPPEGTPAFSAAYPQAVKSGKALHVWARNYDGMFMFRPFGMAALTRFAHGDDEPAFLSDFKDKKSQRTGKVTHPSGAPDNHLLTVWAPGSTPSANRGGVPYDDPVDSGIYLLKDGKPIWEPGKMLLVKNDPNYNEQWPRALVPYKRIYGVDQPALPTPLRNDGKLSKHLPEGTPFGLVGTSSMYKRESYPWGTVSDGKVTATGNPYAAFGQNSWLGSNWSNQGADAGLYENSDIHAIRILAMEPATLPGGRFYNHAHERLRILGEIPVRHFGEPSRVSDRGNGQPLDPDGNPDTSFLAKIPADVPFTFQTLDKDGMVLNMAQTWHQLRPGEIRNNCGGCHAHSQRPTEFKDTRAARPDYALFDLTRHTPLVTAKSADQSGKRWDVKNETGLRFEKSVQNVEYHRDIRPIFERSCTMCHSGKDGRQPAGKLDLDNDKLVDGGHTDVTRVGMVPTSYKTLAVYEGETSTRYIKRFQSRRSLLIWKVFGRRTDGLPANPSKREEADHKTVTAIDFQGSIMPPPGAVAGTYKGPDGKTVKAAALSDEDRRTLVRWIDLGCPIDLDYPVKAASPGWLHDDQRPTLTLTDPRPGANAELSRILIGMHDYGSGLDMKTFRVSADIPLAGVAAGENLAAKFQPKGDGIWELRLPAPLTALEKAKLTIAVHDVQGNRAMIERTFSIQP